MSTPSIQIEPVASRAAHRAFCLLPYTLYRDDPYWVAPLRSDEDARWDPTRNASLQSRTAWRFLARRGGRVVGRIAAVLDPCFAARWGPDAGFFGFFECTRDPEAALALFHAAESVLCERGVNRVLGPVNLTTHDEVGFLAASPGIPPAILEPYNPLWYPDLAVQAGYATLFESHALAWRPDRPPSPAVERLSLAAERKARKGTLRIRRSEPGRWAEEIRLLHALYHAAFADVWGFVPLTWDEFEQRAERFRRFYRAELAVFAEREGAPVGFALALPDINVALRGLRGRLWPFNWLRLAWRVRRLHSVRVILLGVVPGATGAGVAPLLGMELVRAARDLGIVQAELSLVHQDNQSMQHVIEAFGGIPTKTFRLMERRLP
jgi:GNAT superfamily N-acetyltransferase